MSEIVLDGVTKRFGDYVAVADVDLRVRSGELFVLLGPSGCGKTTILRTIAGLERPTSGEVYIDGRRATDLPARRRDVALVFQDYALFPHMDVRENLSFNLRMRGGYDDVDGRVRAVADRLGIAELLDRRIDELSGGQKQRVALGRAIVSEPQAFLLDEPFANLDANLRVAMREEVTRLQADLGVTTIHVTHDQEEALSMGDRIGVIRDGTIQQVGTPEEVYSRPETRYVAGFVGTPTMNFLPGRYDEAARAVHLESETDGGSSIPVEVDAGDGASVVIGIRPEHLTVSDGEPTAGERPTATVERVEFQGADRYVHATTRDGRDLVARVDGDAAVRAGNEVALAFPPDRIHAFGADTGRRLETTGGPGRPGRAGRPDSPVSDQTERP